MAFCGQCGAQLAGNERFCVSCGHDVSAPLAPASEPVAAAAPVAAAPVAPPVTPYPQYYPAPGQYPIVAMPQEVPKHHGGIWWVIIIAAILFGLWWIGTHDQQSQQPGTSPPPGGAPTGGPNAAVIAQQVYTTQWSVVNGDVQLSNQKWVNQSKVSIQSADLECDQYDQSGSDLAQKHVQLTDQTGAAVKPGDTEEFDNLDIGPAVQGLTKVNCGIVGVTPTATPTQ
ncbi:MAG: zinc ribbon domain-containing protein [Terracidiphilus sp.]|jgi:hypothetical protein